MSKQIPTGFGGSPSVWTTAMVFFQCLLFAGYAHAHLLAHLQALRRRTVDGQLQQHQRHRDAGLNAVARQPDRLRKQSARARRAAETCAPPSPKLANRSLTASSRVAQAAP